MQIYTDTLGFSEINDIERVYLLNFWQPASIDWFKDPKKCDRIGNLTLVGFILTQNNDDIKKLEQPGPKEGQLSEERYVGVGRYHGTHSKLGFLITNAGLRLFSSGLIARYMRWVWMPRTDCQRRTG